MLIKERKDLPNFSALLIQLRHSLEENQINLKSDTKEKTIEQINLIFGEKTINDEIEEVKKLISQIKDVEKKIEQEGLASKLDEVKNQISLNTVKIRLHRARQKLRAELATRCDSYWLEENDFVPDLKSALEEFKDSNTI